MSQTGTERRDPGELAFDLTGSLPVRRMPLWLAPPVSLLFGGLLLRAMCAVPPHQALSPGGWLWSAVAYVLIGWGGSAAAAVIFTALLWGRGSADGGRVIARTAAASVWWAPLTVYLLQGSDVVVLAAVLLAAQATVLIRELKGNSAGPAVGFDGPRRLFQVDEPPPFLRAMRPALGAAACIQAGAAAALAPRPGLAALCFAAAAAVIAWCGAGWREAPAAPAAPSPRRMLAVAMCAVLLTGAGLARFLEMPRGGQPAHGVVQRIVAWMEHLFRPGSGVEGAQKRPAVTVARAPEEAAALGAGDFPGVILWPQVQTHTTLVAPLPAYGPGLLGMSRLRPLSIPFDGQYWFYKWPNTRPPRASPVTRGTPDAITFRTVDHRPLKMEAYQNFGTLVDLRCCSKIQIVVRNGDRFPGTVSLELILMDTQHLAQQSLGTADVTSTPRWQNVDAPPPVEEILSYPIPANSAVRQFDVVKIVFQRLPVRWDSSARVAIERFLLVPRGA